MALKTWLRQLALRCTLAPQGAARRRRPARLNKIQPQVELLETRALPSAAVQPTFVLMPRAAAANPSQVLAPAGTSVSQIRTAYGLNGIGDGTGTTIAIVDAYSDPNVTPDLDVFDQQFGLTASGTTLYQQYGAAASFLKVVNETGGTKLPAGNTSWAEEIAIDVEWSHAIAPGAKILLVEANTNNWSDLLTGVSYAADQTGVVVVSMSFAGGEGSGETSYDSYFTTPRGHAGVTFVASSGDSGAPPQYPAISPNVVAVGGTTLNLNASGGIASESAWSGSGGGISAYEKQPSYQKGVVTQSTTMRTDPDVAYDANPTTGFPVYNSYSFAVAQAWEQFGGTSDAAPQWSALIAVTDAERASVGLKSLDGPSQTLPMLYSLPQADFNDITTGSSAVAPYDYSAGPGYDLVTGRGTPIGSQIVAGLLGSTVTSPFATHFSVSTSPSSINAGAAVTVTVTALTSTNSKLTTYNGTVQFASTDPQAVLPPNATLTKGVGTFRVTLKSEGSQSIVAMDAANSYIAGTAAVTVAPLKASSVVFSQQPETAAPGAAIAPAVTVDIVDIYGNILTGDNTDQVTLSLGANAAGDTLSGGGPATVTAGVATFSNLSINNAGNGYTLTAGSGSLAGATSVSFNVIALVYSGANYAQAPGSPIALSASAGEVVVGDVNGDGKLDFAVVAGSPNTTIDIFLGNGDGTFSAGQVIPIGSSVKGLAVGYFNGASNPLDLAYVNAATDTVNVLLGNGNGTFATGASYPLPGAVSGYFDLAAADVNGDGKLDLVVTGGTDQGDNEEVYSAAVFLGNGNGTFQPAISSFVSESSPFVSGKVTVADLIPGGYPDLIIANTAPQGPAAIVLMGNGNGTFAAPEWVGAASGIGGAQNVAVGDFNGDGIPDLAMENVLTGSVSVMLGNGNGTFGAATTYPAGVADPRYLVAADVNGDSKLDLIVSSGTTSTISILSGIGNGAFGSPQTFAVGGTSGGASGNQDDVVVADFNGDGAPDLLVPSIAGDNVTILLHQAPPGNAQVMATAQPGTTTNNTTEPAAQPAAVALSGEQSAIVAGDSVTLSVANILNANPTTTISQVNFYLQGSLTLLGTGTNNNGTWTFIFAESAAGLISGDPYTFVAQAVDSAGALSDPVTVSLMVS